MDTEVEDDSDSVEVTEDEDRERSTVGSLGLEGGGVGRKRGDVASGSVSTTGIASGHEKKGTE